MKDSREQNLKKIIPVIIISAAYRCLLGNCYRKSDGLDSLCLSRASGLALFSLQKGIQAHKQRNNLVAQWLRLWATAGPLNKAINPSSAQLFPVSRVGLDKSVIQMSCELMYMEEGKWCSRGYIALWCSVSNSSKRCVCHQEDSCLGFALRMGGITDCWPDWGENEKNPKIMIYNRWLPNELWRGWWCHAPDVQLSRALCVRIAVTAIQFNPQTAHTALWLI